MHFKVIITYAMKRFTNANRKNWHRPPDLKHLSSNPEWQQQFAAPRSSRSHLDGVFDLVSSGRGACSCWSFNLKSVWFVGFGPPAYLYPLQSYFLVCYFKKPQIRTDKSMTDFIYIYIWNTDYVQRVCFGVCLCVCEAEIDGKPEGDRAI